MGDILVYNAANDNSLTVYRSGAIIKTIRATSISIAAMIKTKMIEEVVPPAPKVTTPKPPVPSPAPKPVPKPKAPPKPPVPKKVVVLKNKWDQNKVERALADPTISSVEVIHPLTERRDGYAKPSGVKASVSIGQPSVGSSEEI